jgi:hypothetical protein
MLGVCSRVFTLVVYQRLFCSKSHQNTRRLDRARATGPHQEEVVRYQRSAVIPRTLWHDPSRLLRACIAGESNCSLSRSTETSPLLTGNGPSLVLEPFAHQADLLVPETSPSSPKSMCEDCNCFTPTPSEVPSKRTADIEDYGRKETSKNGSSSTTTCMSAPIIVSKSTLTSDSSLPCPHNCNGLQSTCFCRTFALETRHHQPTNSI